MFQISQKVIAKWSDSGKRDLDSAAVPSYFATVQSINDDETYDILFNGRTLQTKTDGRYISTEENIKQEIRSNFLQQVEVKNAMKSNMVQKKFTGRKCQMVHSKSWDSTWQPLFLGKAWK